jgi:hypothetical protein
LSYIAHNCSFSVLQNEDGTKVEYRVWNPFRSKLAAAVLGGVDNIYIVNLFVRLTCVLWPFEYKALITVCWLNMRSLAI